MTTGMTARAAWDFSDRECDKVLALIGDFAKLENELDDAEQLLFTVSRSQARAGAYAWRRGLDEWRESRPDLFPEDQEAEVAR